MAVIIKKILIEKDEDRYNDFSLGFKLWSHTSMFRFAENIAAYGT